MATNKIGLLNILNKTMQHQTQRTQRCGGECTELCDRDR